MRFKFFTLFVLSVFMIGFVHDINAQEASEVFPTEGWQHSTPESQGVDSAKLAEALLTIQQHKLDIHSLIIIRNGSMILDAYFYPYDGTTVHDLASVTKSVMTTLIAIAADQGKLSLDAPMVSFFPDRTIANLDAAKERITVRHLASMSSGLECTAENDEQTLTEMRGSPDYIQFTLDLPVVTEPGTAFVYCSPGMHLLSGILQQATGMTAQDFARENLFAPLGIHDFIWESDPQGYTNGWGDLHLQPRDAAKIGYLWLNGGTWEGQQPVSPEWVEESIKLQIHTTEGYGDDYGYGWWVARDAPPSYSAQGRGGQRITVIPALNVIVMTTGSGFELDDITPLLIASLVDMENPLPPNPDGVVQLDAAIAAVVQPPEAQPVTLPDTAYAISGKTFVLDPNPGGLASISLVFDDTAEAQMTVAPVGGEALPPIVVGLDNVFRMTPDKFDLPRGMRGYWEDAQTFVLEEDKIANNEHTYYTMHFEGDHISISTRQTAHTITVTIEGTLQNP